MPARKYSRLTSNSNLNLNTSLNVDDDLLDDLGGRVKVDKTLVDSHLKHVPGLGTLTTGGLAGSNLEVLGGEADGALDAEVLALGALDQLGADLLEGRDFLGGEGDADLVDLLLEDEGLVVCFGVCGGDRSTYGTLAELLLGLLVRHLEDVCARGLKSLWFSRRGRVSFACGVGVRCRARMLLTEDYTEHDSDLVVPAK
jgi:hypothetical protein